ncbi:MAG: hypothetical protein ABIH82_03950 [Candidatus Woesearchaeota archaeon]
MSKWRLPFIANIPVAKEMEIDKEINIEMIFEKEKMEKIRKTYNKPTNLRKVADYLWTHLNEKLSYKKISEETGIDKDAIKILICDLNYYNGFPITMMPVPKKPGFIQSVLDNDEDYEAWDRKKMKTIVTMTQVRGKAGKIVSAKKRTRREKIIIKNENRN